MRRLFVGNLSGETLDADLVGLFSPMGRVIDAQVKIDPATGRCRGFGFVEFETATEAQNAREALHGALLLRRAIRVDLAVDRGRK
jgi:RNA recognition motif-containing protein